MFIIMRMMRFVCGSRLGVITGPISGETLTLEHRGEASHIDKAGVPNITKVLEVVLN